MGWSGKEGQLSQMMGTCRPWRRRGGRLHRLVTLRRKKRCTVRGCKPRAPQAVGRPNIGFAPVDPGGTAHCAPPSIRSIGTRRRRRPKRPGAGYARAHCLIPSFRGIGEKRGGAGVDSLLASTTLLRVSHPAPLLPSMAYMIAPECQLRVTGARSSYSPHRQHVLRRNA